LFNRRDVAEILPKRRKTPINQSINQSTLECLAKTAMETWNAHIHVHSLLPATQGVRIRQYVAYMILHTPGKYLLQLQQTGHVKETSMLKATSAEHRSKFAALSLVMVTVAG
jgi:hypothetical protein